MIGKDWLTQHDEAGRRRLDHEDDWVRREIERGLGKTLIPVLVHGADMPRADWLPSSATFSRIRCAVSRASTSGPTRSCGRSATRAVS